MRPIQTPLNQSPYYKMNWIFGTNETKIDPIRIDEPIQSTGKFGGVISFLDEKIVQKIERKTNSIVETTQNYQIGVLLLITGFFFIAISLLFLPFVILKPYKFCALNAFGTFSLFLSLIFLRGKPILQTLFGKQKISFTLLFFASFACEVYFSVIDPSYLLVLAAFLIHAASIFYLLFSVVPGGVKFLNTVFGSGWSFLKYIVRSGANGTSNSYV